MSEPSAAHSDGTEHTAPASFASTEDAGRVVLLAGNPNSGKTTVFNALTGARAKVGNYPGVTVDRRSATLALPSGAVVELVDLPGTYSLSARSAEEEVAVDAVLGRRGRRPHAVVVIVDATALARGLYLAQQIAETGAPFVLGLSMMDEARSMGLEIDHVKLGELVGAPCVPLVASKREGLDTLLASLETHLASDERDEASAPRLSYAPLPPEDLARLEEAIDAWVTPADPSSRRAWALWALLSVGDDELEDIPSGVRDAVAQVRAGAAEQGRDLDLEIIQARYARIDEILGSVSIQAPRPASERSLTERIDRVLVHPILGFVVFLAVMALVFEGLFAWSDPAISLIENIIAFVQTQLQVWLPDGPLEGLLVDGVVAGVGNVVVFVPQIGLLFLFIGLLEDSGYLSRVAFVLDRLMGGVGLHGKAFVPMLSGFACAVPAVMATRTIESKRDRLLTMLVIPLTSCSARLPVYVLVIAAVFTPDLGPLVLFSMYFLSMFAALAAAAVFRRTVLRGPKPPLVLELPPYRMPILRNLLLDTWERVRTFLVDAGTVILALTIVLWALLSYPKSDEIAGHYASLRDEATDIADEDARAARLAELAGLEAGDQLGYSAAGRIGHAMEPAIEPLGFDWRIGIGILGSFAAREVFVSTLGVVFGIANADEESATLRASLDAAVREDGTPLMTPLVGVSLMVFFVLACQCISTLAVVRRESRSWRWPVFMLGYMTVLAYGASFLVYQVGSMLGWGAA